MCLLGVCIKTNAAIGKVYLPLHFDFIFDLEGQGQILLTMVDNVRVHVKINILRPIVCQIFLM